MAEKKDLTNRTLLFYWQHVWRYPKHVIGTFISVPLAVLFNQFLPPLILASVLSRLARGDFHGHDVWSSFGLELVAYAALALFGGVVMWRIVDIINWKLEGNVQRDIARRVFRHLLAQSASFHANHFGGSLVSQTNKLMGSYIRFVDTTVFQVLPLLSSLVLASIILVGRAPLFVALLIAFALSYMVIAFFVTRDVRRLSAEQSEAESAQTGYLADSVTNVMTIKSFAGSAYEHRQFNKATSWTRSRLMALMRGQVRQQTYFSTMTSSISAASLFMAVVSVMIFQADVATVFLIFSYTANIVGQLFQFSNNSLRNYNRSLGDASPMVEILGITPEIADPAQPEQLRIAKGGIRFKDVTFTHDGSDDALFQKLNLTIQPGEKIGLVGHSGSGKTTFTRLLLRFSDIDGGEILVDGQNIAHITQDDLRRAIAYVAQEPLLFHRPIRENIAYGKDGASEEDILQASRYAHADDFVSALPHGYDTLVGERGVKLSGGQRQRIAIARAMLKDAPILLLDEATSALDSESEVLIQDALWKLMEGRTAIVIAHRLSTIQKMDRIIVLDEGRIVEEGTHAALLRKKGQYAQLWAHQSGGFIED